MEKSQRDLLKCCAVICEGDGVDPRKYKKRDKNSRRKRIHRKNKQLCSQVVQAINLAFAEIDGELVSSLYAKQAIPAPNTSRLLVTIVTNGSNSIEAVQRELARFSGRLRYEISTVIHRKKVPSLAFAIE
ncbi:hypothetical protein [Candidatus Uabimicrobium amorphum]|uniref:Ribosome-binding factor A n=1 Tax=Uabimicrobium amorphum TaxID=2596890 RepID=A0A5S9F3L9_UABAM|nr:hypothetical protein [Candidatus Uabimicrobium amorphum]BBM84875.1 hypothetical protein UABAM_03236 [Candidatus Uabimicrobium amorphum]